MSPHYITKITLPNTGRGFISDKFYLYAGSFVANWQYLKENNFFAVNLTHESSHLPCSLSIPIEDFSVPQNQCLLEFDDNIKEILYSIINEEKTFVGCKGGIGRTGIMVGCISKIFGVDNNQIIYFTRQVLPGALETQEQVEFVKKFNSDRFKEYVDALYLQKYIAQMPAVQDSEADSSNKSAPSTPTQSQKLIQKLAHFTSRYPDNREFVSTLFANNKTAEIYWAINHAIVNPSGLYSFSRSNENLSGNLLDLAIEYKNKELIKDLLLSGIVPTHENLTIGLKDRLTISFLKLSSKIKNFKNFDKLPTLAVDKEKESRKVNV